MTFADYIAKRHEEIYRNSIINGKSKSTRLRKLEALTTLYCKNFCMNNNSACPEHDFYASEMEKCLKFFPEIEEKIKKTNEIFNRIY